jgi:hypothetical protein
MHPEFAKQICAFCAISFSKSFTAFLRLTPDSFTSVDCNSLKLLGVVVAAQVNSGGSIPHVSCDMVEFAIAAASFTLIADECLYNKCHTQAEETVARRLDAYTMAKNLEKSRRHSTLTMARSSI